MLICKKKRCIWRVYCGEGKYYCHKAGNCPICCWLFYRLGYQNGKDDGLKTFERDWKNLIDLADKQNDDWKEAYNELNDDWKAKYNTAAENYERQIETLTKKLNERGKE